MSMFIVMDINLVKKQRLNMITEKKALTKKILEKYPDTATDGGTGNFLNAVVLELYGNNHNIDFNIFTPNTWSRARRKVLNENPHLDKRTEKTKEVEEIVKSEI